ncbi:LOW QUALITY PROTEIN: uncharacterized protein [Primulina eburnea]|uniref:LOW QUALITY PROTEIN: uncharacterized protein n=1 Tax=Primulina eburnea TaxID=1245227 RepID=UPI003C6C209E
MALAEVRAAWQRTANRCLMQEDAKRAPKLACCSSAPPSVKQTDTELASAGGGQEIPTTCSIPCNQNPSYSNSSPCSRWWLQMKPSNGYQRDWWVTILIPSNLTRKPVKCVIAPDILVKKEDYFGTIDQNEHTKDSFDNQCRVFATCEKKDLIVKDEELKALGNKDCSEHYLSSEFPWIGTEKNIPWWRTTDTEELALLVSQRSHDLVQNCDLPAPQNTCVKKDVDVYIYGFSHDGISTSSPDRKSLNAGGHYHLTAHKYTSGSPAAGVSAKSLGCLLKLRKNFLMDSPMQERMSEMQTLENGMKNSQLLQALRHSQTRAREAEKVAKQASVEKQDVLKLVLRQASQLFMYRQWLQLLQLENMYFQFKNNKSDPDSTVFPITMPWISRTTGKVMKSEQKYATRKQKRSCRHPFDVNKYAVILALGMGLVGAGFILGWTIGWLLPAW